MPRKPPTTRPSLPRWIVSPQTTSQNNFFLPSLVPSGRFTTTKRKVINASLSLKCRHLQSRICDNSRELTQQRGDLGKVVPAQRSVVSFFPLPSDFLWVEAFAILRRELSCSRVEMSTLSCGAGTMSHGQQRRS